MATKWEHFPKDLCQVTNDGLTLNRLSPTGSNPEFSVALSGRLEDKEKHEIEVFYSGDCTYFGVGVAQSTIPLQESPRRLEPGNAWFFLNKGFLCDGRTFRDDTLDPGAIFPLPFHAALLKCRSIKLISLPSSLSNPDRLEFPALHFLSPVTRALVPGPKSTCVRAATDLSERPLQLDPIGESP